MIVIKKKSKLDEFADKSRRFLSLEIFICVFLFVRHLHNSFSNWFFKRKKTFRIDIVFECVRSYLSTKMMDNVFRWSIKETGRLFEPSITDGLFVKIVRCPAFDRSLTLISQLTGKGNRVFRRRRRRRTTPNDELRRQFWTVLMINSSSIWWGQQDKEW